ncbi:MAG: replication-associated recombination protein A [Rickettsiella sp.]|nr:replication-associated recombination protein A [Rickettsiella sp.]
MKKINQFVPLATRLRPKNLDEFYGQTHLLGPGKSLRHAILQGQLHSMILWGPPGTGKTTLAKLMANHAQARFESLSALLAGVKEIRTIAERAEFALHKESPKNTLVFIDEIHRFNKAQQDALLPYVESGLFILIGATTENPSFELNNALLSRTRVYILKKLKEKEIIAIIDHALIDSEFGLGSQKLSILEPIKKQLANIADGDARQALNFLEIAAALAENNHIDEKTLEIITHSNLRRFDKKGEFFYDQISALHKAVRGSDPDAALYWLARMLDGGCDPLYIARRIVRMASEDIGNSDPRGLQLALNAWDIQERLGSPEGELSLAQAVVYLACTAKSNAVYTAFKAAMVDAKEHGSLEVPSHLRNAPTKLMRELNYGKDYRYAHNEPDAYVKEESYFPKELANKQYYFPVSRGLELKIAEKLARLKAKT